MKRFRIIILALLVLWFFIPVKNTLASSVQDQLKVTIDNVLEILRDQSLEGEEKREEKKESLRRVIHERFSYATMSQLSLARHWKKRSDEEKKAFIEMFGQLLEEIYVSKIDDYTGEEVVYVKEFVRGKKAQVYTKIITDTVEIPIDYRMYKTEDGKWMVYDLVIEGVSLVGNYRSQFDQILRKETYEKLVEDLKKKLDN
jgi:phospholipid transport system substrate-binding protein